jgi:hypothetical protein
MKLLKDGKHVIASNLCGIQIPINGMYVTYGTSPEKMPPDANPGYFQGISKLDGKGYARIAITSSQLQDDGKILYSAMLTSDDLIGAPITKETILTTATLVHFDEHDRNKDLFVYSAILKNQIQIIPGTYIIVNVGIGIGD